MMNFRYCFNTPPTIERGGIRQKILILLILALISLAASMISNGNRALWDTSETRYAEAAREMVSSGDWMIPHIAGQPHLTKPPMTYWLLALSMKIFGLSEGAVRFPVAVAYALSVMVTAWLGWRLTCSFRAGLMAGLLQMISPLAFFGGHLVTTDTFVALFALLYLSAMWGALTTLRLKRARIWMLIMYLFLGLAFLTKGPPALLPALAALVFLVLFNDYHPWKRLASFSGAGLFIIVSASWYIAVLYLVPDAVSLWKQEAVIKVFVASSRNMPAYYYPIILLGGAMPGVAILIRTLFRRWSAKVGTSVDFSVHQREAILFLGIWIGLPLIIFMASKTRLILYVLPLIPAVNLLAATMSYQFSSHSRGTVLPISASWSITCLVILCVLIGGKVMVARHGDLSKDMKPVAWAIRRDAMERKLTPDLLITMGRMGNGLLYYLEGPSTSRLVADQSIAPSPGKASLLAKAFETEVPDNHSQYVIVANSDMEKYRNKLKDYAVPIYFNGQWGVFRRTVSTPVVLPQSHKPGLMAQSIPNHQGKKHKMLFD